MDKDQLNELIGRLKGANEDLMDYANSLEGRFYISTHPVITRLRGKAEGVRLALSYIEEITRENHNAPE